MGYSPDPFPSIPADRSKLHRIYSDSEEKFIEKTVLYILHNDAKELLPYLYLDPNSGDVPENRVDNDTLVELFKNGLLLSEGDLVFTPLEMATNDYGHDTFYTSVAIATETDIVYDGNALTVMVPRVFYSMEFNPG